MATFPTPISVNISSVSAATWTPISLTGIVPTGTTGVILNWYGGGTVTTWCAVRATGSTDTLTGGSPGGGLNQQMLFTGLRASDLSFDFWTNAIGAGLVLWIVGYFSSDATFFTNTSNVGTMTQNSYVDYDLSSIVPAGAQAALITTHINSVTGTRITGSTDDWITLHTSGLLVPPYAIVGLDANRKMNARTNTASVQLRVMGYITAGITWNANAIDRTPGVAASFQNLTTTTGAIGYLYQFAATAVTNFSVVTSGVSSQPYAQTVRYSGGQMVCGTPPTAKLSSVSGPKIYELGYFTSPLSTWPGLLKRRNNGRFSPLSLWGRML